MENVWVDNSSSMKPLNAPDRFSLLPGYAMCVMYFHKESGEKDCLALAFKINKLEENPQELIYQIRKALAETQ